jgi:hypothetical protein
MRRSPGITAKWLLFLSASDGNCPLFNDGQFFPRLPQLDSCNFSVVGSRAETGACHDRQMNEAAQDVQ